MTWKEIDGWFDFQDVYNLIASRVPAKGQVVEVGCYLGKSACYLASKLPTDSSLFCVDRWPQGEQIADRVPPVENLYAQFVQNVKECGVRERIFDMRMFSIEAAMIFLDHSVFAVYLDGDHTCEGLKSDIIAWERKVMPGGILAGHDYGADHHGVKQAVDELLAGRFRLMGQSWVVEV